MNKIRACLLISIFASGCAVNPSYVGGSSLETKRNILDSLIFLTSEVLYPTGMPENFLDPPEKPSKKKLQELHAQLREILTQITQRNNKRAEVLSRYTSYPLSTLPDFSIELTNSGEPLIHTEISGDLVMDLRVMQALFLSTLLTGLADAWVPRDLFFTSPYDFSSLPDSADHDEIRDRLVEFFELRSAVKKTAAYPVVFDFFEMLFVDSTSDWQVSKMTTYASITAETEERLIGSIVFLLAHEVGHHALGHFSNSVSQLDQDSFKSMELQADRYAAALLADAWGNDSTFGRQERVTLNMHGSALYFRLGENLVGFREGPNRHGWTYPSAEERLSITTALYDKVILQRRKELGYVLRNTWWGERYWTKSKESGDQAK